MTLALALPLGNVVTYLALAGLGVAALVAAVLSVFYFLRARVYERIEETLPAATGDASEMRALGERIEALVGQQQLQGETQRQMLAQKIDAVGQRFDEQRLAVDGLRNEVRHEVRRRDAELDEIRHQLAAIQHAGPALASPSPLALGDGSPPTPSSAPPMAPAADASRPFAPEASVFETFSLDAPAVHAPADLVPSFSVADPSGVMEAPPAPPSFDAAAEHLPTGIVFERVGADARPPAVAPPMPAQPAVSAAPVPAAEPAAPIATAFEPVSFETAPMETGAPATGAPASTLGPVPAPLAWAVVGAPPALSAPPAATAPSETVPLAPVASEPVGLEPATPEPAPTEPVTIEPDAFEPAAAPAEPAADGFAFAETFSDPFATSLSALPTPALPPPAPVSPAPMSPFDTWSVAPAVAPAVAPTPAPEPPTRSPEPMPDAAWVARSDRPEPTTLSPLAPAADPFAQPEPSPPVPSEPVPAPPTALAAPPAGADDLTVVTSIDASVQHALYLAGVTKLDEIARWGRGDARRISAEVGVSEDTIMGQWIFEAQSALFDQYARQAG